MSRTPRDFCLFLAIVRQPHRCSQERLSSSYKRYIYKVYDHPAYKRLESGQLVYDFSLLRTRSDMGPSFMADLRPICLPPRSWWATAFSGEFVRILRAFFISVSMTRGQGMIRVVVMLVDVVCNENLPRTFRAFLFLRWNGQKGQVVVVVLVDQLVDHAV